MIEWALAIIFTWPFIMALALFAVVVESYDNHKFAAFTTIVIGWLCWKVFNIPNMYMIYAATGFIPIGLVWAIWRWKVYCKDSVNYYNERNKRHPDSSYTRDHLQRVLDVKSNSDKLVAWVVCWPISMIERALGDLIRFIRIVVTEWFGNVFKRISESALTEFKPNTIKENPTQRDLNNGNWG